MTDRLDSDKLDNTVTEKKELFNFTHTMKPCKSHQDGQLSCFGKSSFVIRIGGEFGSRHIVVES